MYQSLISILLPSGSLMKQAWWSQLPAGTVPGSVTVKTL
jgi:hypothetical protein